MQDRDFINFDNAVMVPTRYEDDRVKLLLQVSGSKLRITLSESRLSSSLVEIFRRFFKQELPKESEIKLGNVPKVFPTLI